MNRFSPLMNNVADTDLSWRLTVEWSPFVFVFDLGEKENAKKKGVYKEADTNQELHLHLEIRNIGKQN